MEQENSADASLQSGLSSLLNSLVQECDRQAKTLEEIGRLEQKRQSVRTEHEETIRRFPETRWKGRSRSLFHQKYVLSIEREIGISQSECTSRQEKIFAMMAKLRCELDTYWTLHPNTKEVCNEIAAHAILNLSHQIKETIREEQPDILKWSWPKKPNYVRPAAADYFLSIDSCLIARQDFLNFKTRIDQTIGAKQAEGDITRQHSIHNLHDSGFIPSPDFVEVTWNGIKILPTPTQRMVLPVLHEAWKSGHPVLTQESIIEQARLPENTKLRNVFRNSPLWKTLIVSPANGRFRLNLPDPA